MRSCSDPPAAPGMTPWEGATVILSAYWHSLRASRCHSPRKLLGGIEKGKDFAGGATIWSTSLKSCSLASRNVVAICVCLRSRRS